MDFFQHFLSRLTAAVGRPVGASGVEIVSSDRLPSAFAVTDLAVASIASAGLAIRRLVGTDADVRVDQRLAGLWFGSTLAPRGWTLPPQWDDLAGVYETADGFVRLHTNAPHHRAAALRVLGCREDRATVAEVVAQWAAEELESALADAHGVGAALRSRSAWLEHPQGLALQSEPLVHRESHGASIVRSRRPSAARPLAGVRVLDLTRVLAGPVATRLLAGLGADVLRIDPPTWSESGVAAEVNLGKRCARLDLRSRDDRGVFEERLAEADILVHGYRRDALEGLGYGASERRALRPSLVDVSLNAWGHTGPWGDRRGFDSIVQIAGGIAHHGMIACGTESPRSLPVQALDHATGYTLAACALHGWADLQEHGRASTWRTSLAAHAELLWSSVGDADLERDFRPLGGGDLAAEEEATSWGPARRARPPLDVHDVDLVWPNGAADHGTSEATWR
ncbi:MAG: CoA transferase [Acidobacteriota bacterium]